MKPTYGRISRYGALPRSWSLDTMGTIARTASDCAVLTAAIAGRDPCDATTADVPVPEFPQFTEEALPELRIGTPTKFFFDGVEASVRQQLDTAFRVLLSLKLRHVDVAVPDPERLFAISDTIVKSEAAMLHRRWLEDRPEDYSAFVRTRIEAGLHIPATRYLEALSMRGRLLCEFVESAFRNADALFIPTVPIEVPMLRETNAETAADVQRITISLTRCTRSINYLGLPSLTVPCGFSSNGMPVAFQLVGRPFGEATLFRIASAYQSATSWHERKPDLLR